MNSKHRLSGRERSRLERARANGFLEASRTPEAGLTRAYHFWCWQLRLPAVSFERRSRGSRYARVRLDLFTTPHVLTARGRAELAGLGERFGLRSQAAVSAHDAAWDDVPMARAPEFARAVFRLVTRPGSCEPRPAPASPEIVRMFEEIRQKAAWKISA